MAAEAAIRFRSQGQVAKLRHCAAKFPEEQVCRGAAAAAGDAVARQQLRFPFVMGTRAVMDPAFSGSGSSFAPAQKDLDPEPDPH